VETRSSSETSVRLAISSTTGHQNTESHGLYASAIQHKDWMFEKRAAFIRLFI